LLNDGAVLDGWLACGLRVEAREEDKPRMWLWCGLQGATVRGARLAGLRAPAVASRPTNLGAQPPLACAHLLWRAASRAQERNPLWLHAGVHMPAGVSHPIRSWHHEQTSQALHVCPG